MRRPVGLGRRGRHDALDAGARNGVAWTGIVPAVVFLVDRFAGIVPYFGPLGPLTLPLLVGVGGLVTAIGTQFAVDGVLRTALYRYAHDGEFPSALAPDPGRFVETVEAGDGGNGQVTGPTGG